MPRELDPPPTIVTPSIVALAGEMLLLKFAGRTPTALLAVPRSISELRITIVPLSFDVPAVDAWIPTRSAVRVELSPPCRSPTLAWRVRSWAVVFEAGFPMLKTPVLEPGEENGRLTVELVSEAEVKRRTPTTLPVA